MKQQLIDAWQINNKMNLLLINNIDDEGMRKTLSRRGGRTIYLQLVHVHNVRVGWLEVAAKDIAAKSKPIVKDAPYNKKELARSFTESGAAVAELIDRGWEANGKIKGFKKGLIPFIAYLIAHEGHHRGQALLTLKQCGVTLPKVLKWGLWQWDQ